MHLTRLRLEPRSAQARRDLSDAYQMHRTLARAFVADASSPPDRFLWRLEAGSSDWSNPVVLVQSASPANWLALRELPNYLKGEPETRTFDSRQLVQAGADYRFRLHANPTVTRNGKRYGLAAEDEQLAWLSRQGEKHGFEVHAALVSASDMAKMRKADRWMQVQRACFDGVLRVTDSASLAQAIESGIGPAKAFGCGLLSLARR